MIQLRLFLIFTILLIAKTTHAQNFLLGERVRTQVITSVWSGDKNSNQLMSSNSTSTQPMNSYGVIKSSAPVSMPDPQNNNILTQFWFVDFDEGMDGFVAENRIFSPIDLLAPSTPTQFNITVLGNGKVYATWSPSTDDTDTVWYSLSRVNKSVSSKKNYYIDTELVAGSTYTYTLFAYDYYRNRSSSVSQTITIPPQPQNRWENIESFIVKANARRYFEPNDTAEDENHTFGYEEVQELSEGPGGSTCQKFYQTRGGRSGLQAWVRAEDLMPYQEVMFAGAAEYIKPGTNSLKIIASADQVGQFCLSTTAGCESNCSWQNYITNSQTVGMNINWTVPQLSGKYTLYYRFKNKNGNLSTCKSVSTKVSSQSLALNSNWKIEPPSPSTNSRVTFHMPSTELLKTVNMRINSCSGPVIGSSCREELNEKGMDVLLAGRENNLWLEMYTETGLKSCTPLTNYTSDFSIPRVTLNTINLQQLSNGYYILPSNGQLVLSGTCSEENQPVSISGKTSLQVGCVRSVVNGLPTLIWRATIPSSILAEGFQKISVNHNSSKGVWAFSAPQKSIIVPIVKDSTGPVGDFNFSGGNSTTNTLVYLNMNFTDSSPITQVYISDQACSGGGRWFNYSTQLSWILSKIHQDNTLYVVAKDSLGNLSSCKTQTIKHLPPPMFTLDYPRENPLTVDIPVGIITFSGRCAPAGYNITLKTPTGATPTSPPVYNDRIYCKDNLTWEHAVNLNGFVKGTTFVQLGFRATNSSNYILSHTTNIKFFPRPELLLTLDGTKINIDSGIDLGTSPNTDTLIKKIVLSNKGESTLVLNKNPQINLNTGSKGITITKVPSTLTLEPGKSAELDVALLPTAIGAQQGTLSIESNDYRQSNLQIPIRGTVLARPPISTNSPSPAPVRLFQNEYGDEMTAIANQQTLTQFASIIPDLTMSEFEFKLEKILNVKILGEKIFKAIQARERKSFSLGAEAFYNQSLAELGQHPELTLTTTYAALTEFPDDPQAEDRVVLLEFLAEIPNVHIYLKKIFELLLTNIDVEQLGLTGSLSKNGLSYYLSRMNSLYLEMDPDPAIAVPATYRITTIILNPLDQNFLLFQLYKKYPELAVKYLTTRPDLMELSRRLGFSNGATGKEGQYCLSDGLIPNNIKYLPTSPCDAGLTCNNFVCRKLQSVGSKCGFDYPECQSDLECRGASTDLIKTCQRKAGINQFCGGSAGGLSCQEGLTCISPTPGGASVCRSKSNINEFCGGSGSGLACKTGLSCLTFSGVSTCWAPGNIGEMCGSYFAGRECSSGLICSGSAMSPGTCQNPPTVGDCSTGGCATGYDCLILPTGSRTCAPKANINQACGASANGLTCQTPYRCISNTAGASSCRSLALQNDLCGASASGVQCDAAADLQCVGSAGGNNYCRKKALLNQACGGSANGLLCSGSLQCVGSANLNNFKCLAAGLNGESCENGRTCNSGLDCAGPVGARTCQTLAGVGAMCGVSAQGLDCQSGLSCIGGSITYCERRATLGQYCGNQSLGYPSCLPDLRCERTALSLYGICAR